MQSHSIRKMFFIAVAAALLVPAIAQAGSRPDDRAGLRGAQPTIAPTSIRPDDRAGLRGVGPTSTPLTAVRPNDRAGVLGPGPDVVDRYLTSHGAPVATASDDFGWAKLAIAVALGFAALSVAGAGVLRHQRTAANA
jgi:hypothetical protein